jgi:aldose 1-epimerase
MRHSAEPADQIETVPPSGEQIEIRRAEQRAVIVEVGGGLRSYTWDGHELLDGYGLHERCRGARGHTMIPWPNRLRDGTYRFAGQEHQLPLSEPSKRNAIHGLTRWASWRVAARSADRVRMAHVLHPQPGWPFTLALTLGYALGDDGLTVTTTATNVGAQACPYGTGAHPYITLGTPTIDRLVLQAPGRLEIITDDRDIPTGRRPVDGAPLDFREPREIGAAELDTGYGDLERAEDGRARVRIASADAAQAVMVWLDHTYQFVMLFTGDSLPQASRRRRGLGIEPMTCPPNALQSGDGLHILAPAESFVSAWGIQPLDMGTSR